MSGNVESGIDIDHFMSWITPTSSLSIYFKSENKSIPFTLLKINVQRRNVIKEKCVFRGSSSND